MADPKSSAPLGKGQIRCFTCRAPALIKEGKWHQQESQQVFLCKHCATKPAAPPSKVKSPHAK